MAQIQLDSVPKFYQGYVSHVMHLGIQEALLSSNARMLSVIESLSDEMADFAYEKNKWTIRELLCHTMDAERIFCYRALRFSRNDKTPLPGFDENRYVPESNATGRTLPELKAEIERLRATTIDLFNSFTSEMLLRSGTANNTIMSVQALGYVIAGHEFHHCSILLERYLKRTS